MDWDKQQELNEQHVKKPRVGDFWHEMFFPYFLVVEVTKYGLIVLDKTKEVDEHHYTFDETKPRVMTKQELRNAVTYTTMRDKFVANVIPKKQGEQNEP